MRRALVLLPLLAGCARTPPPAPVAVASGPDPAEVAHIVARAADQIRPCYRAPRVARAARQITTVVHVRYAADGMLAAAPEIVRQTNVTPEAAPWADAVAQAAIAAVMRCAPLNLPAGYYSGGWDEFDLTFSPKGLA